MSGAVRGGGGVREVRRVCAVLGGLALSACTLALPYDAIPSELCDNHADDDHDGRIDCGDPDCNAVAPCTPMIPWSAAGAPDIAMPVAACPEGWQVVTEPSGAAWCSPYGADGPPTCVDGWVAYAGSPCTPIGRACTGAVWPSDLPASNVWYVRAGSSGDGTASNPAGTISAVLGAAVGAHGTIAVAAGQYDESITITGGVTIRGVCAGAVRIRPSLSAVGLAAVVSITAGSTPVTLEDLTVDGGATWEGIDARGVDVTLRGVRVANAGTFGVFCAGEATPAALHADGLVIQRVATTAVGSAGLGVRLEQVGVVGLRRVVVEDVHESGISVVGGGSVEGAGIVVRRVARSTTGQTGVGFAADGPTTLDGLLVEDTVGAGVLLGDVSALHHVVVRRVGGVTADERGAAITLQAARPGTRLSLDSLMAEGAATVLDTTAVDAVLADVVVRGGGSAEIGVVARDAEVSVQRALISGLAHAGVVAQQGAAIALSDVVIDAPGRWGAAAVAGAEVQLTRVRIEHAGRAAIAVSGLGSAARIDDVLVRAAPPSEGREGIGIAVQDFATLDGARVRIEGTGEHGLLVRGERARATLADVDLRGGPPCSECAGAGAAAYAGGELELSRFVIAGAARCGVVVASGAAFVSGRGTVFGDGDGACTDGPPSALAGAFWYAGDGDAVRPDAPATPASLEVP